MVIAAVCANATAAILIFVRGNFENSFKTVRNHVVSPGASVQNYKVYRVLVDAAEASGLPIRLYEVAPHAALDHRPRHQAFVLLHDGAALAPPRGSVRPFPVLRRLSQNHHILSPQDPDYQHHTWNLRHSPPPQGCSSSSPVEGLVDRSRRCIHPQEILEGKDSCLRNCANHY